MGVRACAVGAILAGVPLASGAVRLQGDASTRLAGA